MIKLQGQRWERKQVLIIHKISADIAKIGNLYHFITAALKIHNKACNFHCFDIQALKRFLYLWLAIPA